MRRSLVALLIVFVAGVGAFLVTSRDEKPAVPPSPEVGAQPVPLGKSVTQYLPGAEGEAEKWTLTKKIVPREKLSDEVLPQPAPRATPPGVQTEAARTLNTQALNAWRQGELEQAVDLFEQAIEADPEDPAPRSDYGRLLTLMTDYPKAYPHLKRAAELAPNDPQVWVDLVNLYERDILLERAAYAREKAEKLAGGRPMVRDEETQLWVLEGGKVFP
ncbi:MAG: tetratricopeptide repeat protein [Deltaproteobacteria bacterium]|nr:tetratricopeptide repeat protein [Deltaproteobacteria bacterium]